MSLAMCLGSLSSCWIHLGSSTHVFCMIDNYLYVFLSIEDTIISDPIYNFMCRNATPNMPRTSTMLDFCLQTLIIICLCSPLVNKRPSATAKYFRLLLISPEHQLPLFCAALLTFSMSEMQISGCIFLSMKTTFEQTSPVDWGTWFPLVSAGFELMELLNVARFGREIILCLLGCVCNPQHCPGHSDFLKSLNSTPSNTSLLWEMK